MAFVKFTCVEGVKIKCNDGVILEVRSVFQALNLKQELLQSKQVLFDWL